MDVDIACVGFGPATGGFLTTLTKALSDKNAPPLPESKAAPGLPLQILCYERADDVAFGFHQLPKPGQNQGVIVCHQDTRAHQASSFWTGIQAQIFVPSAGLEWTRRNPFSSRNRSCMLVKPSPL